MEKLILAEVLDQRGLYYEIEGFWNKGTLQAIPYAPCKKYPGKTPPVFMEFAEMDLTDGERVKTFLQKYGLFKTVRRILLNTGEIVNHVPYEQLYHSDVPVPDMKSSRYYQQADALVRMGEGPDDSAAIKVLDQETLSKCHKSIVRLVKIWKANDELVSREKEKNQNKLIGELLTTMKHKIANEISSFLDGMSWQVKYDEKSHKFISEITPGDLYDEMIKEYIDYVTHGFSAKHCPICGQPFAASPNRVQKYCTGSIGPCGRTAQQRAYRENKKKNPKADSSES
jgi:hypothetical protein